MRRTHGCPVCPVCSLCLLLALIALGPATASASPILVDVPDTVIVGSADQTVSGSFDVTLSVPDGTDAFAASYNIRLDVDPLGVGLTLVGVQEADNALFPGQTPQVAATGDFLRANDDIAVGENPIEDGMGLLRVLFEVAPGVFGDFQITLNSSETFIFDGTPQAVALDTSSIGTLSVIPEPTTFSLLALGGLLTLTRPRRRSRTRQA